MDKSLRFSKSASITQVCASSIYASKFNGSINMRIEIAAFSTDWLLLKSQTPIKKKGGKSYFACISFESESGGLIGVF